MNDGYFFIIVSWIFILLVWSGWLQHLFKDISFRRMKLLILLIFTLLISSYYYLPVTNSYFINIGTILLLGIIFIYFLWNDTSGFKLQTLAVVLFLGVFYSVAYEMFIMDPILMIISPFYMLPCLLTIFIILTTNEIKHQWLMVLGGFLLGEVMMKIFTLKYIPQVYVGDAYFRDQLAMGFLMVTIAHLLINMVIKAFHILQQYRLHNNQEEPQE